MEKNVYLCTQKSEIMQEVLNLQSIKQYCDTFGFRSRHPLVEVVHCDEPEQLKPYVINWCFYALYLKDMASCTITYGRTQYDHGDKSIIAFAPGQVCQFEAIPGKDPKFVGVLFHPDFIHGTPLGRAIRQYNFFNYEANEALHLSPQEYSVIQSLFGIIDFELDGVDDRQKRTIITSNIQLLLDYCNRFYDRQFTERAQLNHDVLLRFENLLGEYLTNGLAKRNGVPTVNYFADRICLSPNYFGDLIRRETGHSPKDYINQRMLDFAKEQLLSSTQPISNVSELLGFQYQQHFVRFFKKMTGQTPTGFRQNGIINNQDKTLQL